MREGPQFHLHCYVARARMYHMYCIICIICVVSYVSYILYVLYHMYCIICIICTASYVSCQNGTSVVDESDLVNSDATDTSGNVQSQGVATLPLAQGTAH